VDEDDGRRVVGAVDLNVEMDAADRAETQTSVRFGDGEEVGWVSSGCVAGGGVSGGGWGCG
jgi:hypothetical protein